jgi:hypothetical protein
MTTEQAPSGKPLTEQFADLPEGVQSRLFRILDVVLGMSHDEKELVEDWFDAVSRTDSIDEQVRTLARATSGFVCFADRLALGGDEESRTGRPRAGISCVRRGPRR